MTRWNLCAVPGLAVIVVLTWALLASGQAVGQDGYPPVDAAPLPRMITPPRDSVVQFRPVPGLSLATLLKQGFVIVGVTPDRVWVQRRDEAYRCADGAEGPTCEQLVEPFAASR